MKLSIKVHSFSTNAKSSEKLVKNEVTWPTFQPQTQKTKTFYWKKISHVLYATKRNISCTPYTPGWLLIKHKVKQNVISWDLVCL